ncbi:spore germination protein [Psychrobacillus psychrodurans]|uniref:Spore germination protein n=1 Tax=Psychrobacillus psychrodurans TaxID=126157 RepID=A0A9X3LC09_9BACI|nr:spore germination protein [Psychrobacillus psychrodurans]MCZ8535123.1 spore germination protein [Psychrobacillus psychrodurans]
MYTLCANEKPSTPKLMKEVVEKMNNSEDILTIPLQLGDNYAFVLYIKTVVDGLKLQNIIIKPFFELKSTEFFSSYIQSLPDIAKMKTGDELLIQLTKGHVLIAIQEQFFLVDIKMITASTPQPALMEPTIYGPQLALSEAIETNLNMIRHRYLEPSLTIETVQLKDKSHQSIALIYDKKIVKQSVLDEIQKKIKELDNPLIESSGDLQLFLNSTKFSLFPVLLLTERPDRITYNLANGKVVIMMDGSPQAIVAPVVFYDFMVSMEDNYHSFWISIFTLILRYVGILTCILLPAMYVAVTSYTPDIFRVELALSVAGSRLGVPYPSFIEVLFMLLFMEFLIEASIRLPKAISATATTVGGLILGTAATEAALTSNIMIIIVSAVAITSFVIPISEMSFAIRICRYLLLAFTTLFGTVGLMLGFLGIIMFLTNKESFGEPFLKINWKSTKREKEV